MKKKGTSKKLGKEREKDWVGLGGEGEGLERSGVGEGKKIGMLRRGRGREEGGVEFLKWETKWDIHSMVGAKSKISWG